jgi:hypothetical protein
MINKTNITDIRISENSSWYNANKDTETTKMAGN